jgi:hypothetical protein
MAAGIVQSSFCRRCIEDAPENLSRRVERGIVDGLVGAENRLPNRPPAAESRRRLLPS